MAPENSSLSPNPQDSDQKAKPTEEDSIKQIQEGGVVASNNPPQQLDTKTELEPKKDPIKDIQKIVETLHKKFPPPVEEPKSTSGKEKKPKDGSTREKKPKDGSTGEKKPTRENKPPKDESDNSILKLKRNLRLLEEDVNKIRELNTNVADEVKKQISPLQKLLDKLEKDIKNAAKDTTNGSEDNNNATKKDSEVKLTRGMKRDLEDINKKIFNLMCQVPLLPNKSKKEGGLDSDAGDEVNNNKGIVCLPGIHANDGHLKRLAVFRYVEDEFKNLNPLLQICLLSFAVFPENQEVNRTMLMYWWIGENILPDTRAVKNILKDFILPDEEKPPGKGKKNVGPHKDRPEDVVKAILNYFVERKLIEAVENKRKVEPNSYKMNPFVHSSLVLISKEIGLFDMYRKGDKPRMNKSTLHRVCLVEDSSSQTEAKAKKMKDIYQIETVFNVSERFPDFTFKWFAEDVPNKTFGPLSKNTYKALKVFYLGRWERTAKRHIEVENPELMKSLKNMTKLKLLSFQGISRIERLDEAICKLHKLIILDLRACYNLEKLPDTIDSLKELVYLDITDCYMIDRMPKRLSWLDNLEVLKGFVVSDAIEEETFCTLPELKHLKKLRKLSITINKRDLTVEQLFRAIKSFEALEKLKVAWGGMNEHNKKVASGGMNEHNKKVAWGGMNEHNKKVASGGMNEHNKKDPNAGPNLFERTATYILKKNEKTEEQPGLPESLKKLDLQCFPDSELPEWLEPSKLLKLEKLYIKGGKELTGFGTSLPDKPTECKVQVLRLKFLPRLKVEWRDLKELYFPQLKFLEKYQCPQVSLCPCDGIGIWLKPEEL